MNLNFVMQTLHELKAKTKNKEIEDPWLFFIDFKGAYNGVNHEILARKLRKKGIQPGTINLIKFYFNTIAF